jgi:hypothetical protein
MAEALGQDFIDRLPSSWRFKTVASAGDIPETDLLNTSAYPGCILSYRGLMEASALVGDYSSQLFLSGLAISCAAWLSHLADYKITPEYTAVSKFLSEIIGDIAASIHFFFGWELEIVPMKLESARLSCGNTLWSQRVAGLFAIFPICTAATSDFVSKSQRIWLLRTLT